MGSEPHLIESFLAANKSALGTMKWVNHNHRDYAVCQIRVTHTLPSRIRARLILQSHIYRNPRKYMFTLLFGNERVFGLDVDPNRSHRNLFSNKSVSVTHWTTYPCSVAIPDSRTLSHQQWLAEFCKGCNLDFGLPYMPPTHDKVQLSLKL
jgi:hypothetical protein